MGVPSTRHAACPHDAALDALADGELPVDDGGAAVAALRGHVARCAGCRSRWDGLIRTRQLLVAATLATRAPLPADVHAALTAFE